MPEERSFSLDVTAPFDRAKIVVISGDHCINNSFSVDVCVILASVCVSLHDRGTEERVVMMTSILGCRCSCPCHKWHPEWGGPSGRGSSCIGTCQSMVIQMGGRTFPPLHTNPSISCSYAVSYTATVLDDLEMRSRHQDKRGRVEGVQNKRDPMYFSTSLSKSQVFLQLHAKAPMTCLCVGGDACVGA